jgi:hypothetical protein
MPITRITGKRKNTKATFFQAEESRGTVKIELDFISQVIFNCKK